MKQPYTKEKHDELVARGEARLGAHYFFGAVSSKAVVIAQAEVSTIHGEECRCNACFNAKLDAIIASQEAALPQVIETTATIEPVVEAHTRTKASESFIDDLKDTTIYNLPFAVAVEQVKKIQG